MHPIYALWAHPRSMSTATERIMRERGDLDCLHEPFMYDYYVHRKLRDLPGFEVQPDHPKDYEAIRDMILSRAEAGPVFFKDMSYYVMPRILGDADFLDRLQNMFLIRRPRAAILSYRKLDPDLTVEEIGLAAQLRHVEGLRALGRPVTVLRAEDLRADPEGMMQALWSAVGLPFSARAFEWQRSEAPGDWAQVQDWHGAVMGSTGIRPPDPDAERRESEAFDAAAAEDSRLRDLLPPHESAWRALSAIALTPSG
ncbi:hypothetical protein ACFORG_17330 [Lutimaribacter marinistellae]|uniref:Sulfotransferase family protein n=1 Tax=Lutimaribacter marinistellae TaxID=1820329 RepID=A0ABV7TKI7_9RHOB